MMRHCNKGIMCHDDDPDGMMGGSSPQAFFDGTEEEEEVLTDAHRLCCLGFDSVLEIGSTFFIFGTTTRP